MNTKHYSKEEIQKIKNNFVSLAEKTEFLEHIENCDICLELFMESYKDEELISIPFKTPNPSLRIYYEKKRKAEKIKYNIRTVLITAAAVFVVLTIPLDFVEEANKYFNNADKKYQQMFIDLNEKFNYKEVFKYEKKEK